jgi:hypothetical protein
MAFSRRSLYRSERNPLEAPQGGGRQKAVFVRLKGAAGLPIGENQRFRGDAANGPKS